MAEEIKKIAVLGPGGVGGFLAAVFCKNGFDVCCIAQEEAVRRIKTNGISLESGKFGNFTARPEAKTELDFLPDIIFISVKGYSLAEALKKIDRKFVGQNTIIIPLLNGIDHMQVLRNSYPPSSVVAGTISIEAFQKAPGAIAHTSPFARIRLASDYPEINDRLKAVAEILMRTGIEFSIGESESQVLWDKLARLSAISSLTALTGKPIGFIRTDPSLRSRLKNSIIEAAAVAEKAGAHIDPSALIKYADSIDPKQLSSLQRDISKGNPSELDYITGAILRKADAYGVSCPTIRGIFSELQAILP